MTNKNLTTKMQSLGDPRKARKGARMNLHIATTKYYIQEYRDITLNTKLGKSKT